MNIRGIYDQEFLDYTVKALLKAKEYGFKVMIDFHQDVVSTQDPEIAPICSMQDKKKSGAFSPNGRVKLAIF